MSKAKAVKIANTQLESNQTWVRVKQQRLKLRQQGMDQIKLFLLWLTSWLGSGFSGVCFYGTSGIFSIALGIIIGVNLPNKIACPDQKSICYQLRWDKKNVVTPSQLNKLLQEYFQSEKSKKSRK